MARYRLVGALLGGVVVGLFAGTPAAQALINPNFTPIDLFDQSATVLKLTAKATAKPLVFDLQTVQAYKQEKGQKANFTLDLSAAPTKEQAEKVAAELTGQFKGEPLLLFAGEFQQQAAGGGTAGPQMAEGYLHIGGSWINLYKMKDGAGYEMGTYDSHMEGTWAGSTDMLDRCVKYIIAKKTEAAIPVVAGANWDRNPPAVKIGNVPGKVTSAIPVDFGVGPEYSPQRLFIGSADGDKLFAFDPKAGEAGDMVDVTAKAKLASKSLVAVWGDFNRDGRVNLASWDGKALTLCLQQPDGTFVAKPMDTGDSLKDGVVSLAVIDSGKGDTAPPGLVAGTTAGAVLLIPAGEGNLKFAATLLPHPPTTQPDASETAGQCLVADFRNTGLPDIIQLFEKSGVVYKGKAPGQFEAGVPINVCLGPGRSKAWLGDYAGDGTLDIFCVNEEGCLLWQNGGDLKFLNWFGCSGEISYIAKPGGIDGGSCDFNNYGRQGILIIYGADSNGAQPQLFFNRGWRSTGHAHAPLDIDESGALPESKDGQQAGCMGDFAGNGAQDLAVVLKSGNVYVFYRKVFEGEEALAVRACLPLKSGPVGPITVVGYDQDKQCVGAWSVTAGSTSGFFGLRAGNTSRHFEWKTPDGKLNQRDVRVLADPVKFIVEPKK